MRAFDRATANVQWRADPGVSGEGMRADGSSHDIDNGIDRADLVKMDGLDRDIVNLRLRLPE